MSLEVALVVFCPALAKIKLKLGSRWLSSAFHFFAATAGSNIGDERDNPKDR